MTRSIKNSLIISILFVVLIHFEPIWERYPGGFWNILFYLSMTILFFWILIRIIKEIVSLIRKRKNLSYKEFMPIMIMTLFLLEGIFNPLKIDLDKQYGKIVFKACYEGTQNQANLYFRDSGRFEIHWTGVFFYDEFFTGNYTKNNDTILMNFDDEIPRLLGDTLIIKDENIFLLKSDSLITTHFYLGYCKGLN